MPRVPASRLKTLAQQIRDDILRMSYRATSAHTGGALSCVEILVALYFGTITTELDDPINFDRVLLSKGHDAKALYATLAHRGYFPKKLLESYELDNTDLPGHTVRGTIPGVHYSSGSLGHGLPMGVGVALALKRNKSTNRVYVILSDGECDEGTTWEAALFAAHHHLDNVVLIIDENKLQGYGFTKDVLALEPLQKKWSSFGWKVTEVNGHSFAQLNKAYSQIPFKNHSPSVIIAHTIKGKGGVPKYVNTVASQYKSPTKEELAALLKS